MFYIKEEDMGGKLYYMIYIKRFKIFNVFFERWNTLQTASLRLNELNTKQ